MHAITGAGKRLRVLLIVPKLVRDLEGHALVSYYLQHKFGHDVRLYTGSETEQVFLDYEPDALVLDWVGYGDRLRQAQLAKAAGAKLCVLPTAGVFPDESGFLRGAGSANGANHFVDCYLSWGDFAAEAIAGCNVLPPRCVEVTGCPRFDFYADEKLAAVGDRAGFLQRMGGLDPKLPVVLWCTGTNNYNNLHRKPERYVSGLIGAGGFSEATLRMELEDERKQLETHSQLVLQLAQRHPEWNVLIKVHPLEHRQFYFDLARGRSNLFVAPNLNVREFVFHCDVLLQRGCTTATEFWTRGKPVLELQMGNFNLQWAPAEHTAGNHCVGSAEEADRAITSYLAGSPVPATQKTARERYLRRFYHRVDGLSALRCAQRIHREISPPSYTRMDQIHKRALIADIRHKRSEELRWQPMTNLKRIFGFPQSRTLRPWKRSFWTAKDEIKPEAVAKLYARYGAALAQPKAVAVNQG